MKVRWRRHASARSLVREYARAPARDLGCLPEEVLLGPDTFTGFLKRIERMGRWAFVETLAKPPVVHYWASPGTPAASLAFMLGHELGHISGKPARGAMAEEDRADEYGEVVRAVVRRLGLRPPQRDNPARASGRPRKPARERGTRGTTPSRRGRTRTRPAGVRLPAVAR